MVPPKISLQPTMTIYGRRALVDGGFTRLYHKWDSAGTDRYVVNAAAWLANIERFGYNPQ